MSEGLDVATLQAIGTLVAFWFGTLWTVLYWRFRERQAIENVLLKHR